MRLNRYIAQTGTASRRHADELIAGGKVRVNGRVIRDFGTTVEAFDVVEVDGRRIAAPSVRSYYLLHKPAGVVTTMRDPQGRRTVADLLPRAASVVPVGRLDYDTSGALLLTNDGELANLLLHPSFGVEKTYRAVIRGALSPGDLRRLAAGMRLRDVRSAPANARVVTGSEDRCVVEITLREGRNRQVRRMFAALGHPVLALARLRFGPVSLGKLRRGACGR